MSSDVIEFEHWDNDPVYSLAKPLAQTGETAIQ
jgi:hypothetical protein